MKWFKAWWARFLSGMKLRAVARKAMELARREDVKSAFSNRVTIEDNSLLRLGPTHTGGTALEYSAEVSEHINVYLKTFCTSEGSIDTVTVTVDGVEVMEAEMGFCLGTSWSWRVQRGDWEDIILNTA